MRTQREKVKAAYLRYQRETGPRYKFQGRYLTGEEYEAYQKKLKEIFHRPAYTVRKGV